ncbi:hypothetical protein AVEN_243728-1 [Araneus ventricosus]|uniref:Uncharacterized protein n=1 Tax=Araneus ventricosus TaxID=182803 RepID=A0A4Y2A503_ARAVE|nr:hypothetical protein AVEN_243728-1 [Araneus ventricosus]
MGSEVCGYEIGFYRKSTVYIGCSGQVKKRPYGGVLIPLEGISNVEMRNDPNPCTNFRIPLGYSKSSSMTGRTFFWRFISWTGDGYFVTDYSIVKRRNFALVTLNQYKSFVKS